MHENKYPGICKITGTFIYEQGQLVLISLIEHNAYFQTKIKYMFFNGVFLLEA
jgi:hypothetical protein